MVFLSNRKKEKHLNTTYKFMSQCLLSWEDSSLNILNIWDFLIQYNLTIDEWKDDSFLLYMSKDSN